MDAQLRRQGRGEELGRDGGQLPARVRARGELLALEQGRGLGERVGEDAEGGGEGLRVVLVVRGVVVVVVVAGEEGEGEEVDGLGEVGVEVVEGVDVDGVLLGEGEGLDGEGRELDVQGL